MMDIVRFLMRILRLTCSLLLMLLLPISASGEVQIGTGVFPNPQDIEKVLVRGKSTRADVQQLLGIPSGAGGAMLPGFGENSEIVEPYDIWYYEDIMTGNFKSKDNVLLMDLHQQILMIFFKEDKFHGYFWTTNKATGDFR